MKEIYIQQTGIIKKLTDKEAIKAEEFYKLHFKVWDGSHKKYTGTLTNARQDIFMWETDERRKDE